ncbi:MAG: hypothetical protein LBH76_08680 [Propionibacteriaceae bacterium]|jgi:hypothetical protein|nr:hypothetical protein [Propionibacteriaceae bacterium]
MNAEPVFYMVLSMAVIWGTLVASAVFLGLRPELPESEWPPGCPDDDTGD